MCFLNGMIFVYNVHVSSDITDGLLKEKNFSWDTLVLMIVLIRLDDVVYFNSFESLLIATCWHAVEVVGVFLHFANGAVMKAVSKGMQIRL